MKTDKYIKEKVIWITGGTEGIGLHLAKECVELGATVVVSARNESKFKTATRVFQDSKVNFEKLDVTLPEMVNKSAAHLIDKFGHIDHLYNCAGMALPGYLHEQSLEDARQMMELNYFGTVNCVKAVLPHMLERSSGHILNVSSMAGYLGLFGYTNYCASKFAVMGFSWALRNEVKPSGVKVSVLCPPNTLTPGFEKENLIKPKEVLDLESKAKLMSPEEIAKVTLKELSRGKSTILPNLESSLALKLSHYTPWLLDYLLRRPASAAQKERSL
ncbi:MAG: hypothetical protein COT74_05750 [Bdellovibrionales bacterium CG10_big_fil_rev_8_21_14_0_10_45_34]|nr:MAG: hypothetical protein COT74_05750 [Bdellovibrionales bacterium CG10_big_fil_rev_8_21_14_0_10_45_34]